MASSWRLSPGGLLRARGPASTLSSGDADQGVAGGLYIDDKYAVGVGSDETGQQKQRMDEAAEKEGMPAQEEKGEGPDEKERKILGVLLNDRSG